MIRPCRFNVSGAVLLATGILVLVGLSPGQMGAAAPQISTLSLRGLQTGATTTLILEGTDLLPNPRLLLPVAVASQALKRMENPNRIAMDVTLPEHISPSLYQLRLANAKGVSNPLLIGIDDLVQVPFARQVDRLPAAVHGTLPGSATLKTSFAGKKGQRIVVDLEARRLGAAFDPVVDLYDPRQVQLAYAQGQAFLGGDARLDVVLPADGEYTVALHDILYQAGKPSHFRLKVGELSYADRVFPLGGQRDTEGFFELIGKLPSAARRLNVDLRTESAAIPVPLPPAHGLIGPAPQIVVGDVPEVMEVESAKGKLQEVIVPAVINGRIGKPGEEDRFRLLVKPGTELRFEVLANRAGSPLDGVLYVRNESGTQLAMSDDRPNTIDPGLDYTVPDGVTSLVVALTDLEGRGGNDFLYRLAITPANAPDFGLSVFDDRQAIPQGGATVLRVRASRAGYHGPIKLALARLPETITVSGHEIPAGATDTLVTLRTSSGAEPTHLLTRIVGTSTDPKKPIRRLALLPETPVTEMQPWLRSELAVAVIEPGPVQIAWENGSPLLVIGAHYPAKVKVARADGVSGPVRLSLLSSQVVPKASDGKQDDVQRALRIEGTAMIAADQTDGVASLIVPADLPVAPYDLAIRAELLSPDAKNVLATAVTPSRRLHARQPFTLRLAGPFSLEPKSGSGFTGKLKGKVVRAPGFAGPITVRLAGLPDGVPTPTASVAEDRSDFELPIALSSETKLGALLNLKVIASSQMGPQHVTKSSELPVRIQSIQGDSPSPDN